MGRLLLLLLLTLPSWAENSGCFHFFPKSFKVVGGYPVYAVAKNRFVSVGCPPGVKVRVHDRLRGLCLFEDRTVRPFLLTSSQPPLFACTDRRHEVKILSYPFALVPGRLAGLTGGTGAIFNGCCKLAGLVFGNDRWWDKKAIVKLLHGDIRHGDVGLRLDPSKEEAIVAQVDPYANIDLRPGDRIVRIDDVSGTDRRKALVAIDACEAGQSLRMSVRREQRTFVAKLSCYRRLGGGFVPDTFLERFGLRFDKRLQISWIDPASKAAKRGLKRGDRLLMIEGHRVKDAKRVREVLIDMAVAKRSPGRFLWQRDGFQFFLALDTL